MRMRDAIVKCEIKNKLRQHKILLQNYRLCLAIILGLIALTPMYAQSGVQGSSTVSFQNEKLSEVLMQLSKTSKLNFSYDANDPVFETRISYVYKEESIQKVLDNILSNTGLVHKQIGNQIVLFQANESIINDLQTESQEEVKTEANDEIIVTEFDIPAIEMDYRLDTIFLKDTVFRVDTIRVIDTVFIEQQKPEKPVQTKIKEIPVDYFQEGMERDKGWALGVFAAPLLSDFSVIKDQKSFSLRSFSLGIDAMKLLNRWNILFGLRLTQFNQRFTQQYSSSEGGFFDTDTIDAYYTVINTDTAWYYVTDSSWIPLETREYSYEKTNTLGYLELNVSASFDVYKSPKMRLYLKAGGQLSMLIYKNGIAIPGDDQAEGTDFDDLDFNEVNYSFLLGAGLKYKLADKVDFNSELYYAGYLNSLIPDYPIDTKFNAIGLKLGLVFYF